MRPGLLRSLGSLDYAALGGGGVCSILDGEAYTIKNNIQTMQWREEELLIHYWMDYLYEALCIKYHYHEGVKYHKLMF